MNYFCIIFLKRERCIADYFQQYLDAVKNNGEFYRRPLAGNPSRHDAQVDDVNKIKRFMKIICKKKRGVSLETLPTTVTTLLVPVSCTALGWMGRPLWRERVIAMEVNAPTFIKWISIIQLAKYIDIL